ncbi:hypothetical protein A0H81_06822 [Grifola frondosa]|uniref:non-specific serine/threonine protein kinase n=1 Tax=Grifola frondosa TaxID=5627 RepID=A0A1C7M7Z1_GRIFR|nr:hypothetical protein A0H81_06822 [Grifola frondosa]
MQRSLHPLQKSLHSLVLLPKEQRLCSNTSRFRCKSSAGAVHPLPTGEVDPDIFESIGANSLAVRFDINIVKVPWLPLHGIQFRRASGDGWQYHIYGNCHNILKIYDIR